MLPSEVVSKIRVYHSHPIADMMKPWIQKYEWGDAFDNDLPKFIYLRKHFHEVVIDTLAFERGFDDNLHDFDFYQLRKRAVRWDGCDVWYEHCCDVCQCRERVERATLKQLWLEEWKQSNCNACYKNNMICSCPRVIQEMH